MNPPSPVLATSSICRDFQIGKSVIRAVRNVDLTVHPNEFIALMGSSGSGKSTLLHLLGCLDAPTSGSYQFEGQEVNRLSKNQKALIRSRRIGFVFQSYNLLPRSSAEENVLLPLQYQGRIKNSREKANEALEKVSLSGRSRHHPSEMSGGERQRLAIARAIITQPAIILADEPTGNLDSATGEQIMQLFSALHRQGSTLLLVTHDPKVAAYAQRIITMKDGEIISDGGQHDLG